MSDSSKGRGCGVLLLVVVAFGLGALLTNKDLRQNLASQVAEHTGHDPRSLFGSKESSGSSDESSTVTRHRRQASPDPVPTPGSDWSLPDLGMAFVWIPAMNCWVGKYEVTNQEYRRYKSSHKIEKAMDGQSQDSNRQPAGNISYHDAVAFSTWLTDRERSQGLLPDGYVYRLPSRQEWMSFAQCGDGRRYPWGNTWPPKYGNYLDRYIDGYNDGYDLYSCPVERSGRNPWGLYGVGGNVKEWTTERGRSVGGGTIYCLCGAAHVGSADRDRLECASKFWTEPSTRQDYMGFRLLLARPR